MTHPLSDLLPELARRVLAKLSPEEEKIIRMKNGIGESQSYSYEEIARWFCVDTDTIKQLEQSALQKLRKHTVKKRHDDPPICLVPNGT